MPKWRITPSKKTLTMSKNSASLPHTGSALSTGLRMGQKCLRRTLPENSGRLAKSPLWRSCGTAAGVRKVCRQSSLRCTSWAACSWKMAKLHFWAVARDCALNCLDQTHWPGGFCVRPWHLAIIRLQKKSSHWHWLYCFFTLLACGLQWLVIISRSKLCGRPAFCVIFSLYWQRDLYAVESFIDQFCLGSGCTACNRPPHPCALLGRSIHFDRAIIPWPCPGWHLFTSQSSIIRYHFDIWQ